MNRRIINVLVYIIACSAYLSLAASAAASDDTVFGMPALDASKTYTYNTTLDIFIPVRNGEEAVLNWGEKATVDGKEYNVFNLSKLGGGETQYLGVDVRNKTIVMKGLRDLYSPITFMDLTFNPETLVVSYPLWVGKTWEREAVNFSGMVWMGIPVYTEGITQGSAKVTGEEEVAVPAGVAHSLVLETTTNSTMMVHGIKGWMNSSQKLWIMENGFFAKRQLYHDGRLAEELELKEPILAEVNIKPETLNSKSRGILTATVELAQPHDITDIDLSTIELNGVPPVNMHIDDNKLIAKFDRVDLEEKLSTGDAILLTVSGKLIDGTAFEGFDTEEINP